MAETKKRLILAKAESSYGVSPTPTGTDALLVSNLDVKPLELELKDRELIFGYYGNSEKLVGQRMVGISFDVELAGSGTAGTAPRWGAVMNACGFSENVVASTSVTYALVSTGQTSVAIDFYADGTRHLALGCRGTWSLEATAGEIPKIKFELMGIYQAATATSNPTPTYALQADPVVFNSTNTTPVAVHGYAACLEAFSLSLGNETPFRQLAGCTQRVAITDRAPEGEVTIEAPALGTKDYFTAASAQTLGELSFTHGGTAGNIVTFTAPTCNLGSPAYGESDGVLMLKLPFMPVPTSAGNDEFTLVLT